MRNSLQPKYEPQSVSGGLKTPTQVQGGLPSLTGPGATFSPNGLQNMLARGRTVYGAGLTGPPGAGRPREPTPTFTQNGMTMNPMMSHLIQERLRGYQSRAADKSSANWANPSG